MNHDEYMFYKSHGICTRCRKRPAESGITLCLECKMENRKYKSPKDKDKQRISDKTKYDTRKASGMCVVCGNRKQEHGLKCGKCYSKYLINKRKRKSDISRSERPTYGLCYICGQPKMNGKNVCESCYKTRYESIEKIMNMPVVGYWSNLNNSVFKKRSRI